MSIRLNLKILTGCAVVLNDDNNDFSIAGKNDRCKSCCPDVTKYMQCMAICVAILGCSGHQIRSWMVHLFPLPEESKIG